MSDRQPRGSRVLLSKLTVCTSAAGRRYMRGWAGAANLVAFEGEPDEQGRLTWELFLAERQSVAGGPRQPRSGLGWAIDHRERDG